MIHNDKLIIGGHEFNSRFILGSGKYSMKLIEAAIKDAGAEIITLAVRRAIPRSMKTFWTTSPKASPCCPTPPVREPQRKLSALLALQEN